MIASNIAKNPLGIIGFGCWWAWLLAALNSPLLFSGELTSLQIPTSSLNLASVLSGAILSFSLSFSIRRTPRKRTRRTAILASACALALCTAAISNLEYLGISPDFALVTAGVAIGISLSLLQIFWGTCYFTKISGAAIGIVSASSFTFALLVSFLILDKGPISVWLVALLPLVSGLLLIKSDSETSDEKPRSQPAVKTKRGIPLPANLVVLMVLFGASFGVFRMLFLPSAAAASFSSFYYMAIVSLIPMAATLILVVALRKESYLGIAMTIALPFITLGIFVLSLFGSNNQSLELALISAGVRCVDIVTWIMVAHIAKQPSSSPYRVFSFGRGIACLGALCGFAIGSWHGITSDQSLSISLFVLLLLLAASAFSVMKGHQNFPDQASAPSETPDGKPADAESLRTIAEAYGLSDRELEVLELLKVGRTVAYIARKLVVANSTVATHVNHIYRKLDVHNRQELLDFIESHAGGNPSNDAERD